MFKFGVALGSATRPGANTGSLRQTSPSLLDMATQWQHSAQQQLETARLANNNH